MATIVNFLKVPDMSVAPERGCGNRQPRVVLSRFACRRIEELWKQPTQNAGCFSGEPA
jgi:hypothetical protein